MVLSLKIPAAYLAQLLPPRGVGDDGEHELADVEGVPPVVVRHVPVILTHTYQPSEIQKCINNIIRALRFRGRSR